MPLWRTTDPETSRDAALSISEAKVTTSQKLILKLLSYGPKHDAELWAQYCSFACADGLDLISESGCRSRRAELVAMGKVEDSGERVKLPSGRNSIVWRIVND